MSSPTATQLATAKLRNRRAVGLVLMSVFVPGSAQLVVGNRAVGRWAMRIWAAVVAVVLLLGLGLLVLRGPTVGFLFHPWVSPVLRAGVWLYFLGWAALLVDAWRLADPPGLARRGRLWLTGTCLGLVLVAGVGTSVTASALTAVSNVSQVFGGGGESDEKAGRYNILLLGADAAEHREGIRPDSINVASIDAETGRTVLFGLPRNLQRVPFPANSPLHDLYPDGYVCDEGACMLNGIYTVGEDHADLFPDDVDPGVEATMGAVEEVLGLDINYYAMVDMAGFQSLVDAMGGIRLDSNKDIPIGGVSSKISGYIEAGDDIELDGYHALWYARSRAESNDYERMVRQKCVMSAMAKQLDPMTVATRFVALSEAGKDILVTDVGAGHIAELAALALKAKNLDIVSVNFMPPLITSADPDFELIRATVARTIAASQELDDPASGTPAPSPSATKGTATSQSPAPSSSAGEGTVVEADSGETVEESDGAARGEEVEEEWVCRVAS